MKPTKATTPTAQAQPDPPPARDASTEAGGY